MDNPSKETGGKAPGKSLSAIAPLVAFLVLIVPFVMGVAAAIGLLTQTFPVISANGEPAPIPDTTHSAVVGVFLIGAAGAVFVWGIYAKPEKT
jgi:hypothetical protein